MTTPDTINPCALMLSSNLELRHPPRGPSSCPGDWGDAGASLKPGVAKTDPEETPPAHGGDRPAAQHNPPPPRAFKSFLFVLLLTGKQVSKGHSISDPPQQMLLSQPPQQRMLPYHWWDFCWSSEYPSPPSPVMNLCYTLAEHQDIQQWFSRGFKAHHIPQQSVIPT